MRSSIRLRYTAILVSILVAIILAVFLFAKFGLESFIVRQKQTAIKDTIDKIEEALDDGWSKEKYGNKFMRLATQNNFGISICYNGTFSTLIYSTNFNLESANMRFALYMRDGEVDEKMVEAVLEETDDYIIYRTFDERMNNYQIECMGQIDDAYYVITTSMTGIQDSVSIVGRFLLYALLIGVVIAIIAIFLAIKSMSKPIIQLAKQSEDISNLDFSGRFEGKSKDEIGVLGNNINKMSEHLEATIDELQKANAQLEQDIAEKERINKNQKEFLANVSHELKTPIALIQGYAEGLRDGIADDPENADFYTEVIADEANKMNTIVKRLLNLDEIESGRLEPVIEEFNLVEVIKGVISASTYLSKDKDVEIELLAPNEIEVCADEFMIEQVIQNYFSNACHYVSSPGKIVVKAERLAGDESSESHVRVSVSNTGNQIPEEDIPRLWDKFFKVDKAHTRSYGGSGIGLSIVKTIVDLHGGKVDAQNTDEGVSFSFEI